MLKTTAGELLYQAVIEKGSVPITRGHLGRLDRGSVIHVADRPSVTWCRSCNRIVVRGKGRWW